MTVEHITRDGTAMLISDMDDGHLLNTIKWIERRAKEGFYVNCGSSINSGTNSFNFWINSCLDSKVESFKFVKNISTWS